MQPRVAVQHVYKIFGPSPAHAMSLVRDGLGKDDLLQQTGHVLGLEDITFDVNEGEIFVAMGLSGSGKSTLIRCINRLIEPTAGKVLLDGVDVTAADSQELREIRRTKMSMVFQHFALFPHRTVVDNVEYGLKVRGMPRNERRGKALEALENVGLGRWADYYPENLSGGMRQRVGLARGLVTDPAVLLMDEAFSALDPLIRREMQDELIELQRTLKTTILFITHDLNEALKLGTRILVLKDGRSIQIGTPEEIVASPADDYVSDFTRDVDRGRVFSAGSLMHPPEALNLRDDDVRSALRRMRDLGRNDLFVVDNHGRPVGVVFRWDLERARAENVNDLRATTSNDFPTARDIEFIADLYTVVASGTPVAVVDSGGRLSGVLYHSDVLNVLTPDAQPSTNGDAPSGAVASTVQEEA